MPSLLSVRERTGREEQCFPVISSLTQGGSQDGEGLEKILDPRTQKGLDLKQFWKAKTRPRPSFLLY